jgi:hypothetical protein
LTGLIGDIGGIGGWVVQAEDPQGAAFARLGSRI